MTMVPMKGMMLLMMLWLCGPGGGRSEDVVIGHRDDDAAAVDDCAGGGDSDDSEDVGDDSADDADDAEESDDDSASTTMVTDSGDGFRKGYATRRLFAWWTYARLIEQNSGGLFVALLRSRPPGPPTPELRDLAWRLLPAMPLVDLALEDVLQLPEVLGHSWATYELLLGLGHENLQVQLRTMLAYLALRLWEQAPSKERLRRRLASDVSHLLPGIFRLPCGPEPSEGPLHLFAKLMPARRQAGHSIRMDLSPSGL
ncbi:uppS, partial [Symbiodinium necroappetens]